MALTDVLSTSKKTAEGTPESKFVGMKLDWADYLELCQLLSLDASAGGAAAFKVMLSEVLKARA